MSEQAEKERDRRVAGTAAALAAVYAAARAEALVRANAGRIKDALDWKWRGQLQRVVRREAIETVRAIGPIVAESFDVPFWTPNRAEAAAENYLEVMAKEMAAAWERLTEEALAAIDLSVADFEAEIEAALRTGENLAGVDGENVTTTAANLAEHDVATEAGHTTKTWHLGENENHRPSHLAQNNLTVPIDERFPNGQRFPGSPASPAERMNCQCYLTYGGAA